MLMDKPRTLETLQNIAEICCEQADACYFASNEDERRIWTELFFKVKSLKSTLDTINHT